MRAREWGALPHRWALGRRMVRLFAGTVCTAFAAMHVGFVFVGIEAQMFVLFMLVLSGLCA